LKQGSGAPTASHDSTRVILSCSACCPAKSTVPNALADAGAANRPSPTATAIANGFLLDLLTTSSLSGDYAGARAIGAPLPRGSTGDVAGLSARLHEKTPGLGFRSAPERIALALGEVIERRGGRERRSPAPRALSGGS
jgi:hypothetical protein